MRNTALWALLVSLPSAAFADAHADAVATATQNVVDFAGKLDPNSPMPAGVLEDPRMVPANCPKKIAEAKAAGVKPTDVLVGYFDHYAKATKVNGRFQIAFADADGVCAAYAAKYKVDTLATPIRQAAEFVAEHKTGPTAADAKGFNLGAGKTSADTGKACLKSIEQLVKDGVPATTKLKLKTGLVSLEEAKPICQAMIDYGTKFEEFVVIEYKAKQAERSKKYEAAGIKGAKLALMVEYDDVYWRGAGCEKIDDVAVLAKATKLYQWLENADGTHTIRTYLFAGNSVKGKSEKKYQTEKAACAGCK